MTDQPSYNPSDVDKEALYAEAAAFYARRAEQDVAAIRTILGDESGAFRSGSRLKMLRLAAKDLAEDGERLLKRLDAIKNDEES